jgi:predicted transcriptional regulator of viral defense system
MSKRGPVHSAGGVELVRRLAREGVRVFTLAEARELAPAVGLSEGYLRQALHHLAKSGWVIRLHKGLYTLSSSIPGVSPVHEFEIAMALVDPSAISHWSALHHHGLTEQTPRKVFVLTTRGVSIPRVRGRRAVEDGYPVGDTVYRFVQLKPERYFGIQRTWVGEARVAVTDPERTLIDGLSMPQHCGDFGEVLRAFEMLGGNLDLHRIIGYALRMDDATAKRLGWVLERLDTPSGDLERLVTLPIKGYRKLDPTGPRRGPHNRRWMIQENLPGMLDA